MQPQKLCLKWNNHTTNLLAVLGSFQQKDILVDVTISCEGQNIKAHKMVLSACSPYFQNIFLDNPCKHPVVIINGIKYDDITAILNFMYKGEVNVSQDGLSSFLQAAEALKVKGLAEVCGEKKSTNSINQDVQQSDQNRPQRTDTPPRKRHRNRKRSISDSNRSDDEGTSRKHTNREPSSPEIHELSGDESFTGDNTSNGPPFASTPRVPQSVYSRTHQSSSNLGAEEDDDYEVEPAKLLEQTLTTDNVAMNNTNSDNNLRIERIMGNATEIESSSMQEPESPPDIKPIIDYGESSAGPSDGSLMLYSEQSQPGPSNMQDGSLLHDNSHTQGTHERDVLERYNKSSSNHMCETTLLLKELKENPICLCHSGNSNLLEVPIDNELGCSAHKENIKCLKRSKQLLIYNEKGCMKGIELNKDNNSDGSSAFHDLQITSNYIPIHETDTFAEDCTDKNFQPSNSFVQNVERNVSFVSKPRYNFDTLDSGSSQPYTHYIVKKPVRRNKPLINRGQRKSTKKQPKQLHNVASSISNLRRDGEHPVPCTVLEKQSYTQVSVEEVHVAQSSSGSRRPRRNVRKKSASEMLMMRRKIKKQIVQSTSIEYQPKNMNQKQFTSSMDPKITVHREKNAGIKKRSPRKSKGKAVKTNMRRFSELEKYGPEILPPGWNMQITKRKSGKSAGQIDIYFLTPEGKRLRSRIEMAKYLVKNSLPFSAEEFCFRRSAYQNMLTYNPV